MRWKKKTYTTGEIRIIKKFAWFPIKIKNEYRWLEYRWLEYCTVKQKNFTWFSGRCMWTNLEFLD
jgi:hypothetical protein